MQTSQLQQRYWAIVPAAGIGTRMGAEIPKQYLSINGKTILEHTLERLLALSFVEGVVVMINPFDERWDDLPIASHENVVRVDGGQERSDSVLNGLRYLEGRLDKMDWVMVHDAARPCVALDNVEALAEELEDHLVGGILAVPVSDTIKRINREYGIETTVDRQVLWQAQTPQMFRYGVLHEAMERCINNRKAVTDESSAVEQMGYYPMVIEGRRDNIKITRPEDLPMAELILSTQSGAGSSQS